MEKRHFKIYIYSTSNSFHKSLGIMFLSISLRLQQKNHNFPHICLEIDFSYYLQGADKSLKKVQLQKVDSIDCILYKLQSLVYVSLITDLRIRI